MKLDKKLFRINTHAMDVEAAPGFILNTICVESSSP